MSNESNVGSKRLLLSAGFVGFAAGILVAVVAMRFGGPLGEGASSAGLAGTLVTTRNGQVVMQDIASLNLQDGPITGVVEFFRKDGVISAEFDLNSSSPVEVRLELDDASQAFGGVAEAGLPLPPAMVQEGRITMMNNGERRFAVFLNQARSDAKSVKVSFVSGGQVIREETIVLPKL